MTETQRTVANSNHYRSSSATERFGRAMGRLIADGPLRKLLRSAYNHFLLALTGWRGLRSTLPNGEVIRLLPQFRYATWNAVEYAAFRAALREGEVAIDVGANVGAYALLFGQWVGSHGRVYAFEPAALARSGLRKHVELNGLTRIVRVRDEAVGSHVGRALFSGDDANGANHVVTGRELHDGSATDVPAVTLDRVCAAEGVRPSLVKIDAEGAELDVLRGARETIRLNRGRLALFVELHPDMWASRGVSRKDIETELAFQRLAALPLCADRDPWTTNGECVRLVPV